MTVVELTDTSADMPKNDDSQGGVPPIATRLKEAREAVGLTQEELADRVGMRQTGIGSIESGESRRPRRLLEIARAVGKSPEWLLGQEPAAKPSTSTLSNVARRIGMEGVTLVIGEVAAGVWREVDSTDETPFEPIPVAPNPSYPAGGQYGLVVRGTSINRQANDGDIVICIDMGVTGIEPQNNDLVVFERRRQQEGIREVTVKRLRRNGSVIELWPESDDPRFQEPILLNGGSGRDGEEGRVIAIVDWIYRPVRKRM